MQARTWSLVVVMAAATWLWPQRANAEFEGRITVSSGISPGGAGGSADAVFSRAPVWGPLIATRGPCTLHDEPVREGLSAGTITINGTTQTITLEETSGPRGKRYVLGQRVSNPAFREHAMIHVEGSGGMEVPSFEAFVEAPPELTGYTAPKSLSRNGYTATWTPNAGTEILIVVVAIDPRATGRGQVLVCRVPDSGAFTIPSSTFALLPPVLDEAGIVVARVRRTVKLVGDGSIEIEAVNGVASGPFPFEADPHPPTNTPRALPRLLFSFSWGMGGVGRNGETPPTQGFGYRLQFGQRLTRRVHLVEELVGFDTTYFIAPVEMVEGQAAYALGLQWQTTDATARAHTMFPFPGRYSDLRALTLTATVGAAARERSTRMSATDWKDETAWSPTVSLAIAGLGIRGRDWSFSPEFREQLAYFDGHLQRAWMLLLAIRLY